MKTDWRHKMDTRPQSNNHYFMGKEMINELMFDVGVDTEKCVSRVFLWIVGLEELLCVIIITTGHSNRSSGGQSIFIA